MEAEVHDARQLDENVALCHHANGGQRVLDDAHDRLVRLRRDELARHHRELHNLGFCLQRLRN